MVIINVIIWGEDKDLDDDNDDYDDDGNAVAIMDMIVLATKILFLLSTWDT